MMNKLNAISMPLKLVTFSLFLNLPLNLPIAARYPSTDEIGPGFDSTSPSITNCLRFKDEVSYDVFRAWQIKIDVRNVFRGKQIKLDVGNTLRPDSITS